MNINELVLDEDILINVVCENKEEVIMKLVENLDKNNHVNSKEKCYEDILARENQLSTGVGQGIAIPHTQSSSVKECKVSIAKLKDSVEWETLDGTDVKIVILITVPIESQESHLKILESLAEKLMDEALCKDLHNATTIKEIINVLEE